MKKLKIQISNFVSYFDKENFKGGTYPRNIFTEDDQQNFFKTLAPADTIFLSTFPEGLLAKEYIN